MLALLAALLVVEDPAPADVPFFGNERVLLVANGASPASIALARRYAELRHLPDDHRLVLNDVPGAAPGSAEPIGLDECRERILKPLTAWMKERHLEDEVDAIVYSCSFPHAVDVQGITSRLPDFQHVGPTAALTGLTCFARELLVDDYSCLSFQFVTGPNKYAKTSRAENGARDLTPDEKKLLDDSQVQYNAKKFDESAQTLHKLVESYKEFARAWYDLACCEALLGKKDEAIVALSKAVDCGFSNVQHASSDADLESIRKEAAFARLLEQMRARPPTFPPGCGFGNDRDGRGHYYLSTMIAWIGPFGTSEADALAELERDAAADATDPRGTFYFLKNGDVRATTREPFFASAMQQLKERGRSAELLAAGQDGQDGVLPKNRSDVLGAVVGISDFDWKTCGSKIVPGAIVEHLTSCGGMLQAAGQTKLTEFLKVGAAGASGAVTEPYAIVAKFPTPLIHVYYADGCSLAEAFYQSVSSPYQLLIVGDACCRPFAKLAKIELPADATKSAWTGSVTLAPKVVADHFEAWLDGALVAKSASAADPLTIDTTKVADGPHELHVVAIGPPPIGVPSAIARHVVVANHAQDALVATITGPSKPLELGKRVELSGRAPAGAHFELCDGGRTVASGVAIGGTWKVDLPSAALGLGKTLLRLRATTSDASVVSEPLEVATLAPNFAGALSPPGELLPGLAVDVSSNHTGNGTGSGSNAGGSNNSNGIVGTNKRDRRGTLSFSDALPMGDAAKDPNATALVKGFLQLKVAGRHEWSFGGGDLRSLTIDGKKVVAESKSESSANTSVAPVQGFALELAAGWHSFELEVSAHGGHEPRLSLFGPNGAVAFDDATCGQGPTGLKRLAKEKLVAKNAAWCDGNRTVAAPADGDAAELELEGNGERVGAIAVHFVSLGAAGLELEKNVVVETRASGAWTALPAADVRLLRSAPAGGVDDSVLLASAGGRKVKKIRVRALAKDVTALKALAEIEVWEGTPKN